MRPVRTRSHELCPKTGVGLFASAGRCYNDQETVSQCYEVGQGSEVKLVADDHRSMPTTVVGDETIKQMNKKSEASWCGFLRPSACWAILTHRPVHLTLRSRSQPLNLIFCLATVKSRARKSWSQKPQSSLVSIQMPRFSVKYESVARDAHQLLLTIPYQRLPFSGKNSDSSQRGEYAPV